MDVDLIIGVLDEPNAEVGSFRIKLQP